MRAVVQRVRRASVTIAGKSVARIDHGLLVFVAIAAGDGPADRDYLTSKILELRVFADEQGRMNRSVSDAGGSLLVVSQFTLMGDVRRGRRPSFDDAEAPERAEAIYEDFVHALRKSGITVETGVFRADMQVDLQNDGPVTVLLDSRRTF